jgi:hypothetical protein
MPIALIEEESDIFHHYDAAMVERANAVELAVQDEFVDQPEGETAVRRFLAGEFVRQGHARLREQGVAADLLPDEGDLARSLELDTFPDRDREALEQKLRDFVAQTIRDPEGSGDGSGGGDPPPRPAPPIKPPVSGVHQSGHMCVQVSTGIPGPNLGALSARPELKPDTNDFRLAIILSYRFGNLIVATGDSLLCIIDDGPSWLQPTQMLVRMVNTIVPTVAIIAWNRAEGEIGRLQEPGIVTGPTKNMQAELLLTRDCLGADTLCFGRWGGNFNTWVQFSHMDPGTFWGHFGGRRLSFSWRFSAL